MKMKKKDFLFLGTLSVLLLLGVSFLYIKGYFFGATVDWPTQHTMFPEYLRQQFYETKNLFPDFALSLGAGENIYNISYYGLYNPIIMISYLFPFIRMIDYMIFSSILLIIISIILLYVWLKKHNFQDITIKLVTFLFFCAAPLIFQSHRHIMFVNYMPFLLLTLLGIDQYFDKKKISLYIIGILGMILTSYYYSIGGILVSIIYGIYIYLKKNKTISIKQFIQDGLHFLVPIFISIGVTAILLLPTMYVILSGRTGNKEPYSLLELITPHLDIAALVYSAYSVGLTAIIIFALLHNLFTKKKENIFLSLSVILCISIPIVMYALNGFLYVRAKVLIPFLPLCIYIIALYIEDIWNQKFSLRKETIALLATIILLLLTNYQNSLLYIDCFITLVALIFYHEKKKKYILILPLSAIALFTMVTANASEKYQKIEDYNQAFSKEKRELIQSTLEKDSSFYRFNDLTDTLLTVNKVYHPNYYQTSLYSSTLHLDYQNIFYNTFGNADTYRNRLVTSQSSNLLFQTYMNVKYIIAEIGKEPAYYELIEQKGKLGLYYNPYVFPIGYATSNLTSISDYQKQNFPYNIETLLQSIVVEQQTTNQTKSNIKKIEIQGRTNLKSLNVTPYKDGYQIKAKDKETIKVILEEEIPVQQLLLIKFRIEKSANCEDGDLSISIDGITNKLTCKQWMYHNGNYDFEYILSSNQPIKELEVTFSKGTFEIIKEEAYQMDFSNSIKMSKTLDAWKVDRNKTKGNHIEGTITVTQDGYFTTSIPYEENFSIIVDGKKQNYEKVNQAFIGFPIEKGTHDIEITYYAPLKKEGMIISILSVLLWIGIVINKKIKKTL